MIDQKQVRIYSSHRSWRCWRARRLLRRRGYDFEVIDTTGDAELLVWLAHFTGRKAMPYVFIDRRPVGGFGEISVLDRSGELDRLVRGEV